MCDKCFLCVLIVCVSFFIVGGLFSVCDRWWIVVCMMMLLLLLVVNGFFVVFVLVGCLCFVCESCM